MGMVINTNIGAINSSRILNESTQRLQKSLARLSSGSRITSPEDDAAGLAVSLNLSAQINRNSAALNNVQNAISFSQTQDGFLSKVAKALDRMSELSVLARDETKTTADLSLYDLEFQALATFITNTGSKQFNGVDLFSSTGLNVVTSAQCTDPTFGMTGITLNSVTFALSLTTNALASTAHCSLESLISTVAKMRAQVGSNIQRLNFESESLAILNENLSAANSRIVDVDVATESTAFAKNNILVQSGTAMLAQANVLPQSALRLIG